MLRKLQERIIQISKDKKLSHLSSCLTTVGILYEIYSNKLPNDIVILSNGHAGLALYVVLEHFYGLDAEKLFDKHGVHPNRCLEDHIYLSTGSLGMGITVAVGAAIASPEKHVYCIVSDGECAEGSVWEALACIDKLSLENITVYVNINGFSAYDKVNKDSLTKKILAFTCRAVIVDTSKMDDWLPLSRTLEDHYKVI